MATEKPKTFCIYDTLPKGTFFTIPDIQAEKGGITYFGLAALPLLIFLATTTSRFWIEESIGEHFMFAVFPETFARPYAKRILGHQPPRRVS